ncbi:MAG: helix-turn-helix domain-containing protein [Chloroflexi bacterium]|jgi:excisionase family DNA binding protein|nr:helix-turn-helix domain-containing protein [Chloroflexota bacterium]
MSTTNYQLPSITFSTLMRAQEVADILNIKTSTAYSLMQHGDIPSVKVRGSVRVRPEDLANYIQQMRVNTP